jgi:hypothetical protein
MKQISDYYEKARNINPNEGPFLKVPPFPEPVSSNDPEIVGDFFYKLHAYIKAIEDNALLLYMRDQPKREQYLTHNEQKLLSEAYTIAKEELENHRSNGDYVKRKYNNECALQGLKSIFGSGYNGELLPILKKIDATNIDNAICKLSSNLHISKNALKRILRRNQENGKIDEIFFTEVFSLFLSGDGIPKFGNSRMADGSPIIPNQSLLIFDENEFKIY